MIKAINYNLCKKLAMNDELYEESLLTTIEQEKRYRNNVMRKCMVDRGHKVYTGDPY